MTIPETIKILEEMRNETKYSIMAPGLALPRACLDALAIAVEILRRLDNGVAAQREAAMEKTK